MDGAKPFLGQFGTGKGGWYVSGWRDPNGCQLAFPEVDGDSQIGGYAERTPSLAHRRPDHDQREFVGVGERVIYGQRQQAVTALTARGAEETAFHGLGPPP